MKTSYDPAGKFEIKVSEVEFLRTPGGRQLMADLSTAGPDHSPRSSICTAGRGVARTVSARSRWTAPSRRAVSWWWPSI
jgi:hypothetical protein